METGRQTNSDVNSAGLWLKLGGELGTMVGDYVCGGAINLEHMLDQELSCTFGRSEFCRGKKLTILENLSTMVSVTVLLSEGRSPVTKPMEICDQGCLGTGRGRRRPLTGPLEDWTQIKKADKLSYIFQKTGPPQPLLNNKLGWYYHMAS